MLDTELFEQLFLDFLEWEAECEHELSLAFALAIALTPDLALWPFHFFTEEWWEQEEWWEKEAEQEEPFLLFLGALQLPEVFLPFFLMAQTGFLGCFTGVQLLL